jgi:glycerophosphoryl diester phosphodiesterase
VGCKEGKKTGRLPELDELIRLAKEAGLDLNHKFPIDRTFAEKVPSAGLMLYVGTVDEVGDAKRLAEAGVDGITTDPPARLRAALAR